MWYRVDFIKLAMQLLPPILRSKVLLAILKAMLKPLEYIYGLFMSLKSDTDRSLNISCNVQYLQKAMNDAFFLKENQIYIDTPEEENKRVLYLKSENQPDLSISLRSEGAGLTLWNHSESTVRYNFTVHIPTFLCTSPDEDEDQYGGRNLKVIMNILNKYKPAGRTFSIELYDYE